MNDTSSQQMIIPQSEADKFYYNSELAGVPKKGMFPITIFPWN